MSYRGTTLSISMADSGLNFSRNKDGIPASSLVYPSKNINIHEGGVGKRGGTEIVETMAAAPRVLSIYDFALTAANHIIVRTTSAGGIYKDLTTSIGTGLSATEPCFFEVMNKKLYIANFGIAPKIWAGTGSVSNLTNLSADWTGTNYPLAFLLHGTGNSERLWALLPTGAYYSADNAGTSDANFSTGGGQIPISTDDGIGLTAFVEFNDKIIYFGKKKAFFIDDEDADDTKWGWRGSNYDGGVSHQRLIIKTPNDLVAMMDDGEIYSVLKAQSGIGYVNASLTRPSFMHNYIKDYIDLAEINRFHAVYDPSLRAIKFFVITNAGETQCLVYFIDKTSDKAWSIHDGTDNTLSGYRNIYCSALVNGDTVYTGDSAGNIWSLESSVPSDNGNAFYAYITLPENACGNARVQKSFDTGRISAMTRGAVAADLTINAYIDGETTPSFTVSVNLGFSEPNLVDKEFALGTTGNRIGLQITHNSATQSFFISNLMVDFMNLGAGV